MFIDVPATTGNVHTLSAPASATKGGKHAYDYMTSWSQALSGAAAVYGSSAVLSSLNQCGPNLGPPNTMPATCNTVHGTLNYLDVDIPDVMANAMWREIYCLEHRRL